VSGFRGSHRGAIPAAPAWRARDLVLFGVERLRNTSRNSLRGGNVFISAVLKRVKSRGACSADSETGLMDDELRSNLRRSKEADANLAIYR
jgi:hypothetical protein